MFKQNEKVGLFIDAANTHSTLKELEISLDFEHLLTMFKDKCHLITARYYSGLSERDEHHTIKARLDWLMYNGYVVITKPIREMPDGTIKGNMDIEIAVDMMMMYPKLDHIVLFSGDGDFQYLVETIQRFGVTVSVVSTKAKVASSLERQADNFLDLNEFNV